MLVKDRITPMLQPWARQKRRAMTGMRQFADGVVHNDGLSGLSSCGFAREGALNGGSISSLQYYCRSVYRGCATELADFLDRAARARRGLHRALRRHR